ncbi:MAG: hypothetical protein A3H97_14120 [Acidobacteria bacterium RIFCSPLOWO2_02_FULL_65_29]|nr:MAG: hypothetical protein A3H97_14120 [Acidobacteria bacterium RIFCSPLOWO2_02_FULL_65_29]
MSRLLPSAEGPMTKSSYVVACFAFVQLSLAVLVGQPANAQPPTYTFHTIAGQPPGSPFSFASGITVDGAGTIYIYDSSHFVIRKVTPSGLVSIVAGSPVRAGIRPRRRQRGKPVCCGFVVRHDPQDHPGGQCDHAGRIARAER